MQESRFEREVKGQLDELRLHPTAQVWQRLEAGLREKKRRRVLLFFSVLAGVLLLGAGGLYWSMTKTPGAGQTAVQAVNEDPLMTEKMDTVRADGNVKGTVAGSTNGQSEGAGAGTNVEEGSNVAAGSTDQPFVSSMAKPGRQLADKPRNAPAYDKLDLSGKAGTRTARGSFETPAVNSASATPVQKEIALLLGQTPGLQTGAALAANRKTDTVNKDAVVDATTNDALVDAVNKDALVNATTKNALVDSTIKGALIDSVAVIGKQLPRKRRVRFAIDVANGMSDLVKTPAILPVAQDMPAQQFAGNSIFFPAAAPVYYPGEMRGGFAFQVGGSVVYDPVPHLRLTSGLSYAYYSNEVNSGRVIDDSLRQLAVNYSTTIDNRQGPWVVNRFHYLQVPIRAGLVIAPHSARPLEVNLGANLQYLFATTALQFRHQYADAYYLNKDDVNRFAMSIAGGINWNLGARKAFQWSVGPEFSIALKPWTRQTEDVRDRLFYFGLRGRIFLPTGQ